MHATAARREQAQRIAAPQFSPTDAAEGDLQLLEWQAPWRQQRLSTTTSCNGVQAPVSAKPSIKTRHTRMRECNGLQLDADMSDTLAAVKMRCDVSFFAAITLPTLYRAAAMFEERGRALRGWGCCVGAGNAGDCSGGWCGAGGEGCRCRSTTETQPDMCNRTFYCDKTSH